MIVPGRQDAGEKWLPVRGEACVARMNSCIDKEKAQPALLEFRVWEYTGFATQKRVDSRLVVSMAQHTGKLGLNGSPGRNPAGT